MSHKNPVDTIQIEASDPASDGARRLIALSDQYMTRLYPAESNHLDGVNTLRADNVEFFAAKLEQKVVACGAIKFMNGEESYAEIKRVFVDPDYRGKGLSKQMMSRLEACALGRGVRILRLETGIHQPEALALYEGIGYQYRLPFGDYQIDPLSVFMEKTLKG